MSADISGYHKCVCLCVCMRAADVKQVEAGWGQGSCYTFYKAPDSPNSKELPGQKC